MGRECQNKRTRSHPSFRIAQAKLVLIRDFNGAETHQTPTQLPPWKFWSFHRLLMALALSRGMTFEEATKLAIFDFLCCQY